MKIQEEIREGVESFLLGLALRLDGEFYGDLGEEVEEILKYLDSKSVVVLGAKSARYERLIDD